MVELAVAINEAIVHRLVAAQFPRLLPCAIEPVAAQGWDNRCFRLGEAHVARFPASAVYVPQIDRLQSWLPWLADRIEIEIPEFRAKGFPDPEFPHEWAILSWIDGVPGDGISVADARSLARSVGSFLARLHALPIEGGPQPGPENFFRGSSLQVYAPQARAGIIRLGADFDVVRLSRILDRALASESDTVQWVHGDVSPSNLILRDGQLAGVIDWGLCCIGDSACDLAFGWTWLNEHSRGGFLEATGANPACHDRARGWALWKAAILSSGLTSGPANLTDRASGILRSLCEENC